MSVTKKQHHKNKIDENSYFLWVINFFGNFLFSLGHPIYLTLFLIFFKIPCLVGNLIRIKLIKKKPLILSSGYYSKLSANFNNSAVWLMKILKHQIIYEIKLIISSLLFVITLFFSFINKVILLLKTVITLSSNIFSFFIRRLSRVIRFFTLKITFKKGTLLLSFLSLLLFFGFYFLFSFLRSLPSPHMLKTRDISLTTKIYDRNNVLLYKIYKNQNRTLVSLSQIPPYLKQATIAIEDKDFYNHGPLSLRGIIRALHKNIKGDLQGGSTITQQLVKNALLSPERTIDRKIKEIILALETELIFSKDEILTMYFNEVGYGGAAYGIEEASQMYFNKPVEKLTLEESALLAGLPAAPTTYSPFGAHPEYAKTRQEQVLRRMREDGYIDKEKEEKAKNQKLKYALQRTDIKAPHFVMFVKDLLVQKYGEKMVEQGGLSVITTLDIKIQDMVQKEVTEGVSSQKYLSVGNGASIVLKPETGEIISMVGSKDYFNMGGDGNVNVVIMPRQPGSAIKPINYATALELKKITPATIISDTPISYKIEGQPNYTPQNYDGRFRGRVTVRNALANSLNIPAVKILASYGVDEMINMGEKLGITSWNDRSRFGLSLTLGGGEIKMIDLASAFAVFANNGTRINPKSVIKITDYKGEILENNLEKKEQQEVISKGVSYLITNILSDNFARSMVFGQNSPLFIKDHTVAVKTGTTETKKDNWTVGFTKDYVAAVWIGNNDSSPMSPYLESGYSGAAPIWHKIMENLLKDIKDTPVKIPEDVVKLQICAQNGLLPCDGCRVVTEFFLKGTEPKTSCQFIKPTENQKQSDIFPTSSPDLLTIENQNQNLPQETKNPPNQNSVKQKTQKPRLD